MFLLKVGLGMVRLVIKKTISKKESCMSHRKQTSKKTSR